MCFPFKVCAEPDGHLWGRLCGDLDRSLGGHLPYVDLWSLQLFKGDREKNFCNFWWKLFIPGHIAHDWLATVYPDQSLLGFCLSCCPAGEILAHNFKALSFFNCKRESVFIMHVTTGYIHPLPGLLEYAPLQPNGKKAVPLFVPSLKYYSWSLYCLLSCNICHLSMFCIKNQKLIDVFMASSVVKFGTSRYFVFTF